ncbi:MAG TPA: histidine phosphatase family protein [Oscillospiraceae bacterium]|nr:histidine phosphatase family protein [Oscillospiraceae bacterium]HNW04527.1 histidine phosphatase family protein [Oscillospiraceae bacterium]HPW00370.1 histidine phosphatase family protein [Oscillospiraceae bacterium]
MRIYFTRHGATPGNLKQQYIGSTDESLAPEGILVAQRAAEKMPQVGVCYVSPMLRCRETAEILFPDAEKRLVSDMRETDFGDFERKTYEEIKDDPAYGKWLADRGAPPNGESWQHFYSRCTEAFLRVFEEAKAERLDEIAFAVHGGVIMAVMSAFARPQKEFYEYLLPNCGCYAVDADDAGIFTVAERMIPEQE